MGRFFNFEIQQQFSVIAHRNKFFGGFLDIFFLILSKRRTKGQRKLNDYFKKNLSEIDLVEAEICILQSNINDIDM